MAHSFDVGDIADMSDIRLAAITLVRTPQQERIYCIEKLLSPLSNRYFFLSWGFAWRKSIRIKSKKGKKTISMLFFGKKTFL